MNDVAEDLMVEEEDLVVMVVCLVEGEDLVVVVVSLVEAEDLVVFLNGEILNLLYSWNTQLHGIISSLTVCMHVHLLHIIYTDLVLSCSSLLQSHQQGLLHQ